MVQRGHLGRTFMKCIAVNKFMKALADEFIFRSCGLRGVELLLGIVKWLEIGRSSDPELALLEQDQPGVYLRPKVLHSLPRSFEPCVVGKP